MKTATIEVVLQIDVDTEEKLQKVLENMDYSFDYIIWDNLGEGIYERNLITGTEIIT